MKDRPSFLPLILKIAPLLLLIGLALSAAAWLGQSSTTAESQPQLVNMAISVMPEYDQPSVFVSYRGELNQDVATPFDVRIRVPADATIDHACSLKPDNEHICHPFTLEPDGKYAALAYQAATSIIYVEYHYGSVAGAGQRDLGFSFWPPYPTQSLDLFVQEPTQATDFALDPAPAEIMGDQEFRHYSYNFQGLSPDSPVDIKISYSRPTDEPSVLPDQEPSSQAAAQEASSGVPQSLVLVLALAGAVVLGAVLYLAVSRRLRLRPASLTGQATPQRTPVADPQSFFCRHCGHPVRRDATFCTGCGQAVRLPAGEWR
ncbi:MAG: zinc ribbon domain-containing protein [Chloroflexi bacterium]|nr:zinc ribbon domain-containing protein [Chloroflexota bacterium]